MPTFTPVVSSTFTGADESPLSEGSVWVAVTAEDSFQRLSNTARPSNLGNDTGARHTTAIENAQYSRGELTVTGTLGAGSGLGLLVRIASGARTDYRFVIDHAASNNAEIRRFIAGASALLTTWTQSFTDGDQFTFAAENNILYVYDKTLALVQTFDDTGGGGPTSGSCGIAYSSTETVANLDNWEAGTFSTAAAAGGPTLWAQGMI